MIPDHIIETAMDAYVENSPGARCTRTNMEDALEAVAADIWDEGCEAFESAHKCDHIEPWEHLRPNPYRASEGK